MRKFEISTLKEAMTTTKIYETPIFWICLTIMIMCLTRPIKIIICGNGNGSANR